MTIKTRMEFKEGFNPGENNHYTEVNFGSNSQYLPNVTELTIINGGTSEDKGNATPQKGAGLKGLGNRLGEPDPIKDLTVVKRDILSYVTRIASKLKPEKMQCWQRFWTGLLDIDVIEHEICDTTKQQGTTFNRIFVCKIIHYLNNKGFYKEPYNASAMTRALEGDDQHSIRTHGLNWLPEDNVCKRIDDFIEVFNL